MKQNDFDYISSRFENSGVNAPDSLSEQAVSELFEGVQPISEIPSPPKKTKRINKKVLYPVSAAAALALITATAFGLNGFLGNLSTARQRQELGLADIAEYDGLRAFSSRAELTSAVKNVRKLQSGLNTLTKADSAEVYEDIGALDSAENNEYKYSSGTTGGYNGSRDSSFGGTYLQYDDVDEADTVKTDGRYIYRLSDECIDKNGFNVSCIFIFSADPQKPEQVARIELGKLTLRSYDGEMLVSPKEFFIKSNRLIVIEDTYGSASSYVNQTVAEVYDISDINNIVKADSFYQSGSYVSSRMIGDTLYLVSDQHIETENDIPMVGQPESTADEPEMKELSPDCIYAPCRPTTSSFLVVSRIDAASDVQATETKAILGSADVVNCNADSLYIAAPEYDPEIYNYILTENSNALFDYGNGLYRNRSEFSDSTHIYKLTLGDQLAFTADGAVKGMVKDQYALDEKDGRLRVTTTSYDSDGVEVNNLYVLNGELDKLGSVTGFAKNESVKAVRYVGDTAYVITYEQTDPLFVIDVSDPSAPSILGEVKISGFSTMLVPVDDNTLLGIGYHTADGGEIGMEIQDGLKLVVFDVSDRANPKVLDTKIFEGCSSDVQFDPRALLFNPERNDYTIPYSRTVWFEGNQIPEGADAYWMPDYEVTTGMINFKVENGKLIISDNYVSDKFNSEQYEGYAERCVYVGNTVYIIGSTQSKDAPADCKTIVDAVEYK